MSVLHVESESRRQNADELAAMLRKLRMQAGFTTPQLANKARIDRSRISRFEGAHRVPSLDEIETLLDVLKAPPDDRDEVRSLVRSLGSQPESRRLLINRREHVQDDFAALEAAASSIRQYESIFVPALLQTAAYVDAVITGLLWNPPEDDRRSAANARVARQQVLFSSDKSFEFIISTGSLRRGPLRGEAARAQCNHLISLASLRNVRIGIVDDDVEIDVDLHSHGVNITIFDDTLVSTDMTFGNVRSTDARDVSFCVEMFTALSHRASWDEDAIALLETIGREHE